MLESHPEIIDRTGRALKVRAENAETILGNSRAPALVNTSHNHHTGRLSRPGTAALFPPIPTLGATSGSPPRVRRRLFPPRPETTS